MSKNVAGYHPKALEALINYRWFGNVRELENTIERAIVLTDRTEIEMENLPIEIQEFQGGVSIGAVARRRIFDQKSLQDLGDQSD